jgi:thymidylate synthase
MALPPCHFAYQATVLNGRVNLLWSQRSVDTALGLPFNIASYAIFLLLLAKETGYEPGKLVGFLGDTHIYVNHEEGLKEQLSREPLPLPHLKINNFTSIFDWEYTDIELIDYQSHPAIKFDIAV